MSKHRERFPTYVVLILLVATAIISMYYISLIKEEEIQLWLNALQYGAPPHGIAFGLDLHRP